MPILSNLIVRIGASTDEFDKTVDRSLNKVKRFAADVTAAGTALSIGFSAPLIAAGAAAIKAGSDMESLTMGLKAVMKSSEATAAEMAKLREVAKLPGLGLEEAVKGTIRLQILGNSADQSRRIMGELGNALAVVGGGREDFNEVIRQLSQLGAVGKVTKENLDPIIERIPQLAAIIKEKFGPEALGDPAKTFEKLGISSQQFIQIITDELAKGERAGNTYKNSWENIQMAAKDAAAEFGKTLLPIAQRVLDDFLTPGIEKAKAMATAFRDLPQPTQDWALGLTAVATAAPLVLIALGTLIEKGALVVGVLNKGIPLLKGFAASLSVAGVAAGAAAAGVGLFLNWLIQHGGKPIDTTAAAIDNLKKKYDGQILSTGGATDILVGYMKTMGQVTPEVEKHAEAHKKSAEAISDVIKVNTVMLDQNGQLSKNSLVYVESLDRVKAAVGKIKDVMYEYAIQGTAVGKMMETWKAPVSAMTLEFTSMSGAIWTATENMKMMSNLRPPQIEITKAGEAAQSRVGITGANNAAKTLGFESDQQRYQRLQNLQRAVDDVRAAYQRGQATGTDVAKAQEAYNKAAKEGTSSIGSFGKAGKAAMQQVSTVITDLSRGITDVIFKGGKLGDMFVNVAKQAAQSITRLLIEGALQKLTNKLFDVGGLMGKVFGGATSVGGSVFSAASSAGGSVAGAAGSIGGGAASAAGSVGGAVASGGATAIVGAVAGVVGAVSSVIGNFQMMGMNKSLDIIVKHTLQTANDLANLRADEWLREAHLFAKLDDMWKTNLNIYDLLGKGAMAGGTTVTINLNGGDPKAALEEITRTLKQYGVIPRG